MKFLPFLMYVVAFVTGCSPGPLTSDELKDLKSVASVPLNPGGYLSEAEEAKQLSTDEKRSVAGHRGSNDNGRPVFQSTRVFAVNKEALSARVVSFTLEDGKTIQFVGGPALDAAYRQPEGRRAWTGIALDRSGLVLDDHPAQFAAVMQHSGTMYHMANAVVGSRYMIVGKMNPGHFDEPPEMSGHPPFPRGIE